MRLSISVSGAVTDGGEAGEWSSEVELHPTGAMRSAAQVRAVAIGREVSGRETGPSCGVSVDAK